MKRMKLDTGKTCRKTKDRIANKPVVYVFLTIVFRENRL